MPGIDEAASAFSKDMNPGAGRTIDSSENPATMGVEDIFTARAHENDVQAGGDDLPNEGEVQPRRAKAPAKEADGEADEPKTDDDLLYGDEPKKDEEGDGKDAEGEDDEEADPDAEEGAVDEDAKVKITVDGKEEEVTVKEALEGYIRTETFHRRMGELNEVRNTMRTEATTLIEHRREAIDMLASLEEDLKTLMPAEPNWDEAFAKDPQGARSLQKTFNEFKNKLESVRNARNDQQKKLGEAQTLQLTNFAAVERDKFTNLPENKHWTTDTKKQQKDLAAMVRTAKAVGFTAEEIAGTLDSRMLTILLRASKFDRMTANKPKLAPQGKLRTKPGAGNDAGRRTARRGVGRSMQRLAKSGAVDDAAAVFKDILNL